VTQGTGFFSCIVSGCGPNCLESAVLFCSPITYQLVLLYFALNEGNPRTKWGQREILVLKPKPNHFLVIIGASTNECAAYIYDTGVYLTSSDCSLPFECRAQALNQLHSTFVIASVFTYVLFQNEFEKAILSFYLHFLLKIVMKKVVTRGLLLGIFIRLNYLKFIAYRY
jgi:hypothetical protein